MPTNASVRGKYSLQRYRQHWIVQTQQFVYLLIMASVQNESGTESVLTGDAEVIGQNKNVNNLFINKKTNYYYIFFK